ncbi:CHAT domain-containing protein [Luteimicrobium sp. NPDC057192]|uniref:CHAT domain-containing protein n=1 Tax=Luteimicrobium sp. NPDC057192 TaxID=3346042 RepID=UPI00362D6672
MTDPDWDHYADRLARARELNARARASMASAVFEDLVRQLDALEVADLTPEGQGRAATLTCQALVGQAGALHSDTTGLPRALALLDRAATLAPLADERDIIGSIEGQRGFLLARAGDMEGARTAITRGLAGVSRDNHRERAISLLNRGNAAVELGDVRGALDDYRTAHEHARALGQELYVALAMHNVGYAKHLLGDLPGALSAMDEARRHAPEQDDGIPLLGKAEVLVEAGLWTEADGALTEAIPQLQRARLRLDRAEAEYFRARTLLGLERYPEAKRWAALARRHFEAGGHASWTVVARVLELEIELARARKEGLPSARTCRRRALEALDVADRGSATGAVLGREPSVGARLIAVQWLVSAGDVEAARGVLAEVPSNLQGAPLTLRVQRYAVAAELAFTAGDRPAGLRAVKRGFGILAEHRARLGSVDSVAAAAVHAVALNWTDVAAARGTGRASAVFDAVERGRATFAGAARVTPPEDPESAELLATARALLARARELPVDTDPAAVRERADLHRRARVLQDRLRERSWQRAGDAEVAHAVTSRELVRLLGERGDGAVVADFVVFGGRVLAVRADARGMRLFDLADAADVTEKVRRVRADLQIASNELIPAPLHAVAVASLTTGLRRLDDLLVRPLAAEADLYVAARDPLIGLPWSAFPSRRGLRTAVNSHVARGRASDGDGREPRVLAVAGPGVVHADREALAVADGWQQATALTGADASTDSVRRAFEDHDVVHLAAHGRHDADNPLFACIELADGPLFAHELDGLHLPQSVVVLSACEVGGVTPGLGGEVLGLTSVLLRLGARAVIASVAPLPDVVAADLMPRLHAELRASDDPEGALALALADADEPVPLVCFSSVAGLAAVSA